MLNQEYLKTGESLVVIIYISSLLCTIIFMRCFISFLNNKKAIRSNEKIDSIKKPCIKELHKNKLGTPTMGGVVMNSVLLIMSIVYYLLNREILWVNIFILLFGMMGFVDDYIKVRKVRDGVTPKEKLIGLTIISTAFILFLMYTNNINTDILIPFIEGTAKLNTIVYSIFMIILLVGTTNSINITDGLDGLVLGISIIVLTFIAIIAWQTNNAEILYSALVIQSTCIGSLIFNKYPAKIFMGDTGALFLGGAISIFMIKLRIPLWIFIILIPCLWNTLTVIIQLTSLKFSGKKVFKIAPYHHHLEKCGWKETKIVYSFWLSTAVMCAVGYIAL